MKSLHVVLATLAVLLASSTCWAQQKYSITEGPKSESKYLQEQIIDVGDRPGHQLRVYRTAKHLSRK